MENDTNQADEGLTSTMATVNTTPTTDSLPSSSSDANKSETINDNNKGSEDPISSTSDADEVDKCAIAVPTRINEKENLTTSGSTSKIDEDIENHTMDRETELFASEYNLETTPAHKITENVEDIVSDLETLLGTPEEDFVNPHVQAIKEDIVEVREEERLEPLKADESVEVIEKETVELVKEDENSSGDSENQEQENKIAERLKEENLEPIKEDQETVELVKEEKDAAGDSANREQEDTLVQTEKLSEESVTADVKENVDVSIPTEAKVDDAEKENLEVQEEHEKLVEQEKEEMETEEVEEPEKQEINAEKVEEDEKHKETKNRIEMEEVPIICKTIDSDPSPEIPVLAEEISSEAENVTIEPVTLPSQVSEEKVESLHKTSEEISIVEDPEKTSQEEHKEKETFTPMDLSKADIETDEENAPEVTEETKPEVIAVEEAKLQGEPVKEVANQEEPEDVEMEITPPLETSIIEPKFPVEEIPASPPQIQAETDPKIALKPDLPEPETPLVIEPETPIVVEPESLEMEIDEELTPEIKEHSESKIETEPIDNLAPKETEPEYIDQEAELVRAAFEASSVANEGNKVEDDVDQGHFISDEDVIRAAMDCTRNDEEDLIKAAQECQERELQDESDDEPEEVVERSIIIRKEEQEEEPIPAIAVVEEPETSDDFGITSVEPEVESCVNDEKGPPENLEVILPQNINIVQDYQKPLNIVVESVVKEAESTMNDDFEHENKSKESSDEDKPEEYSSKISQNQELKLTIRKTKAEESSILKIYDPKEPDPMVEISPSESETDPETESPLPKLVIKQSQLSPQMISPLKITFKSMPMVKPDEPQKSSPKLIIKPIVKPDEELHHSPKITIKPIPKPEELERCNSPKITIKPIIKPSESCISPKIKIKPIPKPEEEPEEPERIVLKISKRERERERTPKPEETEKLGKIKLKFSMDGGHAHIVSEEDEELDDSKRIKLDLSLSESTTSQNSSMEIDTRPEIVTVAPLPTPKRRGRPRKVPLEVRLEIEEPIVLEQTIAVPERPERVSTRPKRSCRGPSVRDTLGLKIRKPRERGRARGRGRGGRGRGRGSKALEDLDLENEKLVESKLKLIKEAAITAQVNASFEQHYQDLDMTLEPEDLKIEQPVGKLQLSSYDDVMYEEDTRMSSDSRAQTPAKQMITPNLFNPPDMIKEESQSSVQSTATTESLKLKKTKMEIEPEGAVISADQLAEYYWGGGGPYMLQEQVAQYLGINSFKRKYRGIPRRQVDMQERDFIRESGLASEHMCDLGLTAVNSADILDLMYSDFQPKYEEYCKHQRDRQTKDIANKQKALSLAASQEKNKIDIMQQAVESAAQWNAGFNKTRREERKACMDLQTFTINFPKGKTRQVNRPKVGDYPIALVPGQYTDYYKDFTPTELNNLPMNTMLYRPINIPTEEDSQSDASGSESDSTSSGTDSSDSDSSDDNCNICSPSGTPTPAITSNSSKKLSI